MRPMCEKIHEFADGELSASDADAFTEHLALCPACPRELEGIFALKGLAETSLPESVAPATREIRQVRSGRRVAWFWAGLAGLVSCGAAAALFLIPHLRGPAADGAWLATNQSRPLEPRLPDPRGDRYAQLDRMRGADDHRPPPSYTVLEDLQKRGDVRGLIDHQLFTGEIAEARKLLAQPAVQADQRFDHERAVLALLDNEPREALRLTRAVLQRSPGSPQALWNRALGLRDLHASQAAAAAFDTVAALGEPGWSEDARGQSQSLRQGAGTLREQWRAAQEETDRLVTAGTAPSAQVLANFPDLVRAKLYQAVRTAGSRAALDRLEPVARGLDAHYGEGTLVQTLQRTRSLDPARRAPLAARYRQLLAQGWQPPGEVANYVAALRGAGPVARDLLLGVLLGAPTAAQPGELDRLAREQNDPWFDAAVVEATLGASGSGDESAREQRLNDAADAAGKHKLHGAQLRLRLYRAYLMLDQHRVAEAEPLVQLALLEAQKRGLASFATAPLLERAAGYQGDSEVFTAYREEVVQERGAERHRGP